MPEQVALADSRIVKSRARLQSGLLDLLADRRFDDITVAEIVERSGVGYATFYRHYGDKRALWTATANALLAELECRMKPGLDSGDYLDAVLSLCRYIDANKAVYRVLLAGGARDQTLAEMMARARSMAKVGGSIEAPGLPPMIGAVFAVNAVFAMLSWWLEERDDLPPEAVADIVEKLVYRPLFSVIRGGDSPKPPA